MHFYRFSFGCAEIRKPGQTDFERKSSAEEREAYKGTLSEETAIAKGNLIKRKKTAGFQPRFLLNNTKVTKEAPCKQDAPFSFCDYTKIPKSRINNSLFLPQKSSEDVHIQGTQEEP